MLSPNRYNRKKLKLLLTVFNKLKNIYAFSYSVSQTTYPSAHLYICLHASTPHCQLKRLKKMVKFEDDFRRLK